jgi:hypothetical protein
MLFWGRPLTRGLLHYGVGAGAARDRGVVNLLLLGRLTKHGRPGQGT